VTEQERFDRLRLARTDRVGPVAFRELLRRYGSAGAALEAIPEISRRGGSAVRPPHEDDIRRELDAGEAAGARLLVLGDADFPPQLAAVDPPPPVLWTLGDAAILSRRCVGVVGARIASAGGQRFARALASELGQAGYAVISGMARGIDAAAHEGALPHGTAAVLGGGIGDVYPPENAGLYERLAEEGCIVSESPVGHRAQARDFPRRNRIISGLSLGVVVVEAAERSGALITAALAGDLGREVFAIPGRLTSDTSRGPHGLLRDGATLVRSWMDIVQEIPSPWRDAVRDAAVLDTPARAALSAEESAVLGALAADEPRHIEDVIARCGLPSGRVGATLLALELGGHARQLEGQRWLPVDARARRA